MSSARGWRAPLFWIATGSFIGIVGAPLLVAVVECVVTLAVHLHATSAAYGITIALMLGGPLAFFALVFGDTRARVDRALRWVDRPGVRILLLVAAAALVAFSRAVLSVEGLDPGSRATGELGEAMSSIDYYGSVLALSAPLALGALLAGIRSGTNEKHKTWDLERAAPILWLTLGCLASVVSFELGTWAWSATLWLAGFFHLGTFAMKSVVWGITLATPPLSIACAYGWLERRSPGRLLGGRVFHVALGLAVVLAVAGWLTIGPVWAGARSRLDLAVYDVALEARAFASVVIGGLMPVVAGAIMLRLRREVGSSPAPALRS